MKKLAFILVVLFCVTSTFAVAADQKAGSKVPVQMTDAEMAQVVGGAQALPPIGSGYYLSIITKELISLTYKLPLTYDQQRLIEDKLRCLNSLFSKNIKTVRVPLRDTDI